MADTGIKILQWNICSFKVRGLELLSHINDYILTNNMATSYSSAIIVLSDPATWHAVSLKSHRRHRWV